MFEVAGAQGLKVSDNGDLLIQTASGYVTQHRPMAYQKTIAGRREVDARYRVSGDTVSFQVGNYDHSSELIVDPVIAFSIPRLLGIDAIQGTGVAVDTAGNTWVMGNTIPRNTNPNTPTAFYTEVFVIEINLAGDETSSLIFGALDGNTSGSSIATDNAGSVYITGTDRKSVV